mgnify:CR=1 FL=1
MKINYEDLKIGQKYFITDPDSEEVKECLLDNIRLKGIDNDEGINYAFEYNKEVDEDGDKRTGYIHLESKDGKEIFDGEYTKIEIYLTKEEAEENRVRILIEGCQALIESCKRDIIKFEKKILELRK